VLADGLGGWAILSRLVDGVEAGALTVTLVADPDRVPDLDVLARALQAELDGYTRLSGATAP
jgi:hypothetical protein